ncbi:helix-turn-helix domain-containing protein [Methylobacterium sp. 22177]|uniref:helix-turn-helix domain-containing protein n=1 Tax=Methylobacterium sp. 22177 TaxID=3453885 RepID=UPI003F87A7AA
MSGAFRYAADEGGEEGLPCGKGGEVELHFERVFTIAEVSEKLGLSPRQVKAHIDDGNLIAVDVGRGKERRDLRILDEDLEGFVRRRKTGAVPTLAVREPATPPPLPSAPVGYAARREARLAARR